ncbi:MAG: hypothetical protein KDE26_05960 [Bacteroidetes bacterium]|nr:hypothetical protein [Bacteroidota bacterium]MCB0842798.1 hypothetical protein [Bacteroidota bacterium]
MKSFLIKLTVYSLAIYLINLVIGLGFKALGPKYSDAAYGQVKWENFRSLPADSLDVLFLGSSHFLSGIDPAVIDSVSGMTSYNMARVGLRPASAYVLLNEVIEKQHPKVVVLDIFYRTFTGAGYNHLYDFGYVEYDQSKVAFALDNFTVAENARLFFPTYVYRSHFPKLRPLLGLRTKKDNWEELHYKGYVKHPEIIEVSDLEQNEFMNYHFDKDQIDPKNLVYLDKLVKLCAKNDIKMIWVSTPLPEICLESIQNQSDIDAYFQDLADKYDVPYLNYNTNQLRQKVSFSDSSDYSDDDHLNVTGAEKISQDIAYRILHKDYMLAAGE